MRWVQHSESRIKSSLIVNKTPHINIKILSQSGSTQIRLDTMNSSLTFPIAFYYYYYSLFYFFMTFFLSFFLPFYADFFSLFLSFAFRNVLQYRHSFLTFSLLFFIFVFLDFLSLYLFSLLCWHLLPFCFYLNDLQKKKKNCFSYHRKKRHNEYTVTDSLNK